MRIRKAVEPSSPGSVGFPRASALAADIMILALPFLMHSPLLAGGQSRGLKDDLGHEWTIGTPPVRIVSLAPNVTEILFALGLEDRIVGVTRYCDYPAGALAKEKVGGLVDPSLERVSALKPDLILAFRGNPVRILEKMRNIGLPVFSLEPGLSLESLLGTIRTVGLVTGREEAARTLAGDLESQIKAIDALLAGVAVKPKVFLNLQGQALWTCGRESFLDALILRAGGVNIAGGIAKKWVLLGREEILHQDPDVVVIMAKSEPAFVRAADWFRSEPRLKHLKAVAAGRIGFLDENKASRFGPRLVDTLRELVRILHPAPAGKTP